MPAPIIAAAAVAARLAARKLAKDTAKKSAAKLTMRQKAGKAVVNATTGKYATRNYVEFSMRANVKKAAAKKSAKSVKEALKTAKKSKPLTEPKSAVKVKPAARQKPNKYNPVKDEVRYIDSVARGASKMPVSQISKGKLKDARAFKASKKSK